MNKNNFQIPRDRKEKIEFLKAVFRGEKTINDLADQRVYRFTQDHLVDPNYYLSEYGRLTREQITQLGKRSQHRNDLFIIVNYANRHGNTNYNTGENGTSLTLDLTK